jgi:D-alanyl-D-alanine carboxypeptidase
MKKLLLFLFMVLLAGSVCAQQPAAQLLSISFQKANNPSLTSEVSVSTIGANTLVTLPIGTSLTALRANFTAPTGTTVSANGVVQTSGVSVNDFSKPVVYQVSAPVGTSLSYTIEASVQVDLATVENAVKAFMTKYNVPGMSVAITKDERLVYAKGYGFADKDKGLPVTPTSMFRVASVSKAITGIAAMKLVDDGKLNLDQKVFGAGNTLGITYGSQPYSPQMSQITMRHLLTHTAGGEAWNHKWNYPTRIDPFYQPEWLGYTQAQVISATIDTRPVTETPGTKGVYSNVGVNIAGRVIEKIAGVGYEKYVQDNILIPLGISPETMRIGGSKLADRFPNEVVYYNPYAGYDQPYDFSVPRFDAHGGWVSTAPNLAWLMVHVDGGTQRKDILTTKSQKDMIAPIPVSVPTGGYAGFANGWSASVNGAFWKDGGMAGTASYWLKIGTYTFAILINTRDASDQYYTDIDKLCYQMSDNLTLSTFMKGDQFGLFYPNAQSTYCTPLQRDVWSCGSAEGTIGLESIKIWSADKTATLLDSKGVCSQNGNAYSDFTTTQPAVKLTRGVSVPFQAEVMRIQAGANKGAFYPTRVSIWLDLNQDQTFTNDERLFVSNPSVASPNPLLESQFTVPNISLLGKTRMRVRIGTAFSATPETPCEQIDGETEDYLVDVGAPCVLSTTLTASNAVLCQGSSVTLTASATGSQSALSCNWQRDGVALGTTTGSLSVSLPGTYQVTATDDKGCVGTAAAFTLTQKPNPNAQIIGVGLLANNMASLSANVGPGLAYQWSLNGTALPGATAATYTVQQSGLYRVIVTNNDGCTSSSPGFAVNLAPVVGSGREAVETTESGASLAVSPNPSSGQIMIRLRLSDPAPATLRLTDLGGRTHWQWTSETSQTNYQQQADIRELPAGLYLVIAEAAGQRVVQKLVRE